MDNDDVEVKESRREILAKAWDEAEDKKDDNRESDNSRLGVGEEQRITESDVGKKEVSDDNESAGGREKVAKSQEIGKKSAEDETQKKEVDAARAEVAGRSAPATDRAPNSWKPAIREHWANLPPEVRAEVSRRELEVQQTLSQTAQVRRFAQDFAQTINPYSHLIRAQGSTPLQAVNNLMGTAARLMQGNQQEKATTVAEIIANYGIDIQVLDQVLSNGTYNPGNAPSQTQAVPTWAKPIFGFMDNLQRMQEQRQLQIQQEADQAIQQLEQRPFFEDVREDMADLMETAANRGRVLTMEQAYEKAIALNPEISKIVEQRKRAETSRNPVSEAAATLARARKAASSVKGSPAGTKAGANGKMTRRQQLSEAWDDTQS